MDDRTRGLAIIFLGVLGLGAVFGITACGIAHSEIPPSLTTTVLAVVASIAALAPPSSGGKLEETKKVAERVEQYTHEAKHDLVGSMNALSLRIQEGITILKMMAPAGTLQTGPTSPGSMERRS